MKDINKISKIRPEELSTEQYFQSLLEQACELGMLTDIQLEKIQYDCISLLAKQTEKYNSGDSSSIKVENAQHLLASIMFTMGVWLKTYQNPDEAVEAMLNESISDLYKKGLVRIERLTKSTKTLHSLITGNLLQTENVYYKSTIVDGIKGFFKLYYPEFAAQDIHITADYPAYNQKERLFGIEFIHKYLECIYYENLFCTKFSAEDIHYLLCGYNENYQQLLFNIYEQVLIAAIGCVLSGDAVHRLEMTPSSIKILSDLFSGKSKNEIIKILEKAVEQLNTLMELTQPLKKYISNSLIQIAEEIENAVELRTLKCVFIIPKYPDRASKITFNFGDKMDDERYRKILDEIMQCRYLEDKKAIIKSQIHSLADLEDVLLDAELNEVEILSILRDLKPAEIMALLKKHSIPSVLDPYELSENQIALGNSLKKFLELLSESQKEMLRQMAEVIDNTENLME